MVPCMESHTASPVRYAFAGMIAMAAHYKFLKGEFSALDVTPLARMPI